MAAAQAKAAAEAKQKEKKKQKPMLLPKCCNGCFRSLSSSKALEQTDQGTKKNLLKKDRLEVCRGITTTRLLPVIF